MSAPSIQPVRVGAEVGAVQRAFNQMRDRVQAAVTELHGRLGGDHVLLEGVKIFTPGAGTDVLVNHGLGRKAKGFRVVRKNQHADVWESSTTPTDPLNTLVLQTDFTTSAVNGGLTISLEVF